MLTSRTDVLGLVRQHQPDLGFVTSGPVRSVGGGSVNHCFGKMSQSVSLVGYRDYGTRARVGGC